MVIECPHCNVAFDISSSVLKERKPQYRWYEFTGKASYCPHCGQQFQVDLSIKGGLFVLLLLLVVSPLAYFEYELVAGGIVICALYLGKKYYGKVMKVTAINAT